MTVKVVTVALIKKQPEEDTNLMHLCCNLICIFLVLLNKMEVIEIFTTQDYTNEQMRELVYDENSSWELLFDKWRRA